MACVLFSYILACGKCVSDLKYILSTVLTLIGQEHSVGTSWHEQEVQTHSCKVILGGDFTIVISCTEIYIYARQEFWLNWTCNSAG